MHQSTIRNAYTDIFISLGVGLLLKPRENFAEAFCLIGYEVWTSLISIQCVLRVCTLSILMFVEHRLSKLGVEIPSLPFVIDTREKLARGNSKAKWIQLAMLICTLYNNNIINIEFPCPLDGNELSVGTYETKMITTIVVMPTTAR